MEVWAVAGDLFIFRSWSSLPLHRPQFLLELHPRYIHWVAVGGGWPVTQMAGAGDLSRKWLSALHTAAGSLVNAHTFMWNCTVDQKHYRCQPLTVLQTYISLKGLKCISSEIKNGKKVEQIKINHTFKSKLILLFKIVANLFIYSWLT
jgi:hypothetical protein